MVIGGFCKNACQQCIITISGAATKKKIGDHQGMLKVIQHALTIANFTIDQPALLEINCKIATMGGGGGVFLRLNKIGCVGLFCGGFFWGF